MAQPSRDGQEPSALARPWASITTRAWMHSRPTPATSIFRRALIGSNGGDAEAALAKAATTFQPKNKISGCGPARWSSPAARQRRRPDAEIVFGRVDEEVAHPHPSQ